MKVRAFVNFALIKYWGKKNEEYKIPYQSSLSLTVDKLYTETKTTFDQSLLEDVITINGKTSGKAVLRVRKYLNKLRELYNIEEYCYLESQNFVPTASGLASSASAFASIASSFLKHLNLSDSELSKAARLGSGSGSRSIFGGFSLWDKGDSHETSFAKPLNINWPEIRIIVCLVSEVEKKHSSGEAMRLSTKNPKYLEFVKNSEKDLTEMLKALKLKDINLVGNIAERNSEMMHNLMALDNIVYKNNDSNRLINIIKDLRQKGIPAYFTMDAGPNVKIITTSEYVDQIVQKIPFKTIVCQNGESPLIIK